MEALKCPSCGSPDLEKNSINEYQCRNCHTRSKLSSDHTYLVVDGYPCPECGAYNDNADKFCGNCGKRLIKICVHCGTETHIMKKFCSNCGQNEFWDTDFYCVVLKPGRNIEVIKLLREIFNLGLVEAKVISEKESVIAAKVSLQEAQGIKMRFEKIGAIIEIVSTPLPLDPYIQEAMG